jgi:hypothetical protein
MAYFDNILLFDFQSCDMHGRLGVLLRGQAYVGHDIANPGTTDMVPETIEKTNVTESAS